ncbi:MAG: hypothetical protein AAF937_09770 [Planctomycetota bacterium]
MHLLLGQVLSGKLLFGLPTLSQITGPDSAAIPALPPAPFYEAWLFENPLPLTLALMGLGIALLMLFFRLGKAKQGGLICAVALVLAAGAFAAGRIVETPRETLAESTGRLVDATAGGDGVIMRELLNEGVTLDGGRYKFIPTITGREPLVTRAEALPRDVVRVVVLETRAGLDGPNVARTQVRLWAFGPGDQLYGHSWWGLDWQQRDGAWTAVGIEPLWIQGG